MVIHYTRTEPGRREVISTISSTSSHHNSDSNACPKCNYKSDIHRGVVKTCLDCFLSGQNHIYLYKYGVSELQTLSDLNPGGTRVHSRPPSQVVNFASNLLEKSGFGNYNLFLKNCEDFAYYCKTGELGSGQVKLNGAPVKARMGCVPEIDILVRLRYRDDDKTVIALR
ncbi:LRAT domain [Dillenia turbinata]|uniref:LRAT domain n=1 Tax=Dillenia turbinata TaxID=194707 RepID=A0AAN8UJM8_9MAGN